MKSGKTGADVQGRAETLYDEQQQRVEQERKLFRMDKKKKPEPDPDRPA